MNRTVLALAVLAGAADNAIAQVALTPAPSTRATAVVTLNPPRGTQGASPARITVNYGQPHLRGRSLHSGGLVPMDTVWRLGANEATELETEVDLTIGGQAVPKGKYTLFALPTASGWKLIVNKNTGQWGTDYQMQHDLTRVDLRHRTLSQPVESLSLWLIPSTQRGAAGGELRFAWGTHELSTNWTVR